MPDQPREGARLSGPTRVSPFDIATRVVHAGAPPHESDTPVVHPLFQSVNFNQEIGTGDGLRYPRYGNSLNAEVVQERVAALEGAEAAVLLVSGMGAVACALLALLRPGDHLLASAAIYGGVSRLLSTEFATFGIDVTLIDPMETRVWRKRLRKTTRAIFVETPIVRAKGADAPLGLSNQAKGADAPLGLPRG